MRSLALIRRVNKNYNSLVILPVQSMVNCMMGDDDAKESGGEINNLFVNILLIDSES